MQNNHDFGFNTEEFLGELSSIPYAQFINASDKKFGIAITSTNAELAKFELTDAWKPVEHEFRDGTQETLLLTKSPKLLILNRSQALMSNDFETLPYDKQKHDAEGYKAFSYVIVWFLDDNNKPLSQLPFRLKCSGYAGLTFLQNYSYYNVADCFCKQFLAVYKSLTGDRAIDKNEIFYAHAIYQPTFVRKLVTSSVNGQKSSAVITESFVQPTPDNFASLIIKNGSEISIKIKQLIQTTKSWLKSESDTQQFANSDGNGI
ncbi:MAG: hypothetical protein KME09_00960 [Pleurocapsa minor HA4230-MV1]|jgi:hypothetical protein|nr:hypothetical protein [Pleurocapsa minor HA4230-MV1]